MTAVMEHTSAPEPTRKPKMSLFSRTTILIVGVLVVFGVLYLTIVGLNARHKSDQTCLIKARAASVGINLISPCQGDYNPSAFRADQEIQPTKIQNGQEYLLKQGDNVIPVRMVVFGRDQPLVDFLLTPSGKVSLQTSLTFWQLGIDKLGDGNGLFPTNISTR